MGRSLRYLGALLLAATVWLLISGAAGWVTEDLAERLSRTTAGAGIACMIGGILLGLLGKLGFSRRRGRCVRCGASTERGNSFCLDHLLQAVADYRDRTEAHHPLDQLAATRPVALLVLLGPTGTGKSEIACRVAQALGGEIIGCDSLQVYSGLDVATAKPPPADRSRIPHHLVDVADPRRDYSVADYVSAADAAITEVRSRGRVPIVVGGTGMYLRALLRGLVPAPGRDPRLRARLLRMAERFGVTRLHRWLGTLDRASAQRIPAGDSQRIVRALEVALLGENTWSDVLAARGTWGAGAERYAAVKIGIDLPREILVRRLDERVDGFFAAGLEEEVRMLLRAGVPAQANAFKAIGYREVLAALLRGDDPASVRAEVKRNTRRYAKRQRTWFRSEPGVHWLDASSGIDATARAIVDLWGEKQDAD